MDGLFLLCFGFLGAIANALWSYSHGEAWYQVVMAYSAGGTLAMTAGTVIAMLFSPRD